MGNVRFWHLTDNQTAPAFARYWTKADNGGFRPYGPKWTSRLDEKPVSDCNALALNGVALLLRFGYNFFNDPVH